MRVTNGITALGLATIIALAGIGAGAAPVAATDPSPSPTASIEPAAPSPDPSAGATPAPSAPTPTPAPSASAAAIVVRTVVRPDYRSRVKRIALRQRWDAYVRGAVGPNRFDCSGLVRYSYSRAGVGRKLGGGHSARGMLNWGRLHGLTSRRHPRIGDVVIYGNGSHAAIYIGNGYVISALNPRQDIKVTRLHALTAPVTTFIHTRI